MTRIAVDVVGRTGGAAGVHARRCCGEVVVDVEVWRGRRGGCAVDPAARGEVGTSVCICEDAGEREVGGRTAEHATADVVDDCVEGEIGGTAAIVSETDAIATSGCPIARDYRVDDVEGRRSDLDADPLIVQDIAAVHVQGRAAGHTFIQL